MTNQEAALKSLEGKMQIADSGLLFVEGKPLIKFSEYGSSHNQNPKQQSKNSPKG